MPSSEPAFLPEYFKALDPQQPLAPDDKRRVALHPRSNSLDPVAELQTSIEWASLDSIHLFSGSRGIGKTTELRRLAAQLRERGALVVETDMREYLNLEDVVDISHFLLSIAGAFGDALDTPELLGNDPKHEGYWRRFYNFVTRTEVDLTGLSEATSSMGIDLGVKAALLDNPSFRARLGEHMRTNMSAFIRDVHTYVNECVAQLRARHGADARIVFILDSIEHLSVDTLNQAQVTSALVRIFSTYAKDLRFEGLHVVYTVPPWLRVANKGLLGFYDSVFTLPCVKVRNRDGQIDDEGLGLLTTVIERRAPRWRELFEDQAQLRRLILSSGGYIRDLFKLVQACLRMARDKRPLTSNDVGLILAQYSNNYRPISHVDARWLQRVAQTHDAELEDQTKLSLLAGYFDAHLVLCYVNGKEWYDVHPLIADDVRGLSDEAAGS